MTEIQLNDFIEAEKSRVRLRLIDFGYNSDLAEALADFGAEAARADPDSIRMGDVQQVGDRLVQELVIPAGLVIPQMQTLEEFENQVAIELNEAYLGSIIASTDADYARSLANSAAFTATSTPLCKRAAELAAECRAAADAVANGPPLRPVSPIVLADLRPPPRRWIVPEWVPAGVVTGLYGDGGLGKSLLAQQLQTAMAIGEPWLALPVESGPLSQFTVRIHTMNCGAGRWTSMPRIKSTSVHSVTSIGCPASAKTTC